MIQGDRRWAARLAPALGLALALAGPACTGRREAGPGDGQAPRPSAATSGPRTAAGRTYAGSGACAACHPVEHARWRGSHHALAQLDVPPMVLEAARAGEARAGEARAVVRGGRVVLESAALGAATGAAASGVIGVAPLVQLLVPGGGGRLQATALALDVTRGDWFDLHAGEPRAPGDFGHWTGRGMTWNSQCAYCHVTGFTKGYDAGRDLYRSGWVELGVGCEACHGPRAGHAARAAARGARPPPPAPPAPRSMSRLPGRPDPWTATCAACHARRRQLGDGVVAGEGAPDGEERLLDLFDPDLPDDPAWYPDGQVREEDYEWASFVQSVMYQRGVACSDCHEPHAGTLRAQGNRLCLQCHPPALDAPAHTLHRAGPGARCVDCHMPPTTYMVRHVRRDHSFSRPLPALRAALGVPSACERCHADRGPAWVARAFERGYGRRERPSARRAAAVAAARQGRPEAAPALLALLGEPRTPALWRAVAATLLGALSPERPEVARALERTLGDRSPLVRARAARALGDRSGAAPGAAAALRDPVRLVRVSAAWSMRALPPAELPPEQARALAAALDEARAAARYDADQPWGRHEAALLAPGPRQAEPEYRAALRLDPRAVPARFNLAELLLTDGRAAEAVALLDEGLRLDARAAALHYALARARLAGGLAGVIPALERTLALDPEYPGARTSLGLAYVQAGRRAEARRALRDSVARDPADGRARRALEALEGATGR